MTALSSAAPKPEDAALAPCTLRELVLYFLRLGTFGFGGPIALAGYMQRDIVETSAAATGAIAGAAFILGRRAIFDVPTLLICAGTLAVIVKVKKLPEPVVIVASGLVGLALHRLLGLDAAAPR